MRSAKSIGRTIRTRQERHLWRLSVVSLSALVALAALFVDGFPPKSWKAWLGLKDAQPVVAALVPKRIVPGQVTVTMPKPRGNESSASPLPLPLILVSTRLGRNSREGFAELGVDASSPQTYSAGAVLANGARLTEIYDDHVVLERSGQSARLYIQGHGGTPKAQDLTTLVTVGGVAPALIAATPHEALTDFIRPSAVYRGKVLTGLQVYPGKEASTFDALGLQSGDVIVAIDGTAVSDVDAALSRLRSLVSGAALTVEVQREGSARSVSLDGSVLVSAMQRGRAPTLCANVT